MKRQHRVLHITKFKCSRLLPMQNTIVARGQMSKFNRTPRARLGARVRSNVSDRWHALRGKPQVLTPPI